MLFDNSWPYLMPYTLQGNMKKEPRFRGAPLIS